MYPQGAVEEMRRKGMRFEGDAAARAPNNPWEATAAQHGGYWKAGFDDEATSLFSPSQMEEVNRAALRPSENLAPRAPAARPPVARPSPSPPLTPKVPPAARQAPPPAPRIPSDLRAIPDHSPTGLFPVMDVPLLPSSVKAASAEKAAHPPAMSVGNSPSTSGNFDEEPTAMFMGEDDMNALDLRSIPDHGRTGLIVPMKVLPPATASAPSPPGVKVHIQRADSEPQVAPPRPEPRATNPPASPLASLSPAREGAPSAPGPAMRSGASLEQIQRLRVVSAGRSSSPLGRMPGWLVWMLIAMTAGGLALLLAGLFLWLKA